MVPEGDVQAAAGGLLRRPGFDQLLAEPPVVRPRRTTHGGRGRGVMVGGGGGGGWVEGLPGGRGPGEGGRGCRSLLGVGVVVDETGRWRGGCGDDGGRVGVRWEPEAVSYLGDDDVRVSGGE